MTNLLNLIAEHLTTIATLANLLFITAAFLYIYLRAGSILFLRDRLWKFFGGKASFSSPKLQKLKDDERELEHFKFEFDVPASTLREAELFENWITTKNLSLRDVIHAKKYIDWQDFNNLNIKDISIKSRTWISAIIAILLYTTMVMAFALAIPKYAMIKLADTNYFYISEENIKFSIFSNNYLNKKSCESDENLSPLINESQLPIEKLISLCEELNKEQNKKAINNILLEQRITLSILGIFCFFSFFIVIRYVAKVHAAKRIKGRLIPD
ncbi:DUF6216 family protein [Pseudomonas asuensis]|uniref:DUF1461 domain-containing protein n=1 Tax=Pseudomonas asuensis TaxID=1825787 RepID=A0ABQ2H1M5_9PSED|nr:DUF6216 family protein [Pseudomonas asuensis]GGM23269.1 hypothetical protein GCM10009425_37650 [Pseudomonas asuensis]